MSFLSGLETKAGTPADADALKGKVVALYFSAHWCPPCRGRSGSSPQPLEWPPDNHFEVIFVSSDDSAAEQAQYMKEMHGDWLRVPFGDACSTLKQKYGCFGRKEHPRWPSATRRNGIPALVVIGPDGSELEFDGTSAISKAGVPDSWYAKFAWPS